MLQVRRLARAGAAVAKERGNRTQRIRQPDRRRQPDARPSEQKERGDYGMLVSAWLCHDKTAEPRRAPARDEQRGILGGAPPEGAVSRGASWEGLCHQVMGLGASRGCLRSRFGGRRPEKIPRLRKHRGRASACDGGSAVWCASAASGLRRRALLGGVRLRVKGKHQEELSHASAISCSAK
jgi:hypothetical protein